jgi:hypothetical protein
MAQPRALERTFRDLTSTFVDGVFVGRAFTIQETHMHRLQRWTLIAFGFGLAGCSGNADSTTNAQGGSGGSGGSATTGGVGGTAGSTAGHATSFAQVDEEGSVVSVGVTIPVKSFETVPSDDPAFQSSVGLEMPDSVRDRVFIQLLRINWLPSGHGPAPYNPPHFDMHFYRGTKEEVTAISCADSGQFPAAILADGYETPSTCVSGMGYHAWPSADIQTNTFTASIILGYAAQQLVFVEPMITQELLLQRQSFERSIIRPSSAGGAPTLFPSHLTVTYSATTDSYSFQFDQFEPMDL